MKIKIPTNCPCCEYTLELVNDQLFCRNQACGAQLGKKLEHFIATGNLISRSNLDLQ
jgi:NAD-dependent DNA ligase